MVRELHSYQPQLWSSVTKAARRLEHRIREGERREDVTGEGLGWGLPLAAQAAVGWSWSWEDLKYWAQSRVSDAFVQP